MGAICSTNALISNNSKNYKGILSIYETKSIFHNEERIIDVFKYDLRTAEFITGIERVSFLGLYEKDKSFLQIKMRECASPKYILDENKIQEILCAVDNYKKSHILKEPERHADFEKIIDVSDYNEKALNVFLYNPYSILGISSRASYAEADDALQKIRKLDRLKVIDSYQPVFHLAGIPGIKRTVAICQNAYVGIKELSNKWFWFETEEACKNWQFSWYRGRKTREITEVKYDQFLAQYVYSLVFDDAFEQRNEWYEVFAYYQYIVGNNNCEPLKAKLGEEYKHISDEEIIKSYSDNIWKPLDYLLETKGILALLRLYRTLRMDRYENMKDYKRNLGSRISQWFISKQEELWNKIEQYIGVGELDEEAADHVWEAAQEYDQEVQIILNNVLSAMTNEPLRTEMILTSYKKVMRQVMVLLLAGNKKAEASKYGNYLYKHADMKTKLQIVAACGVENISGAIDDLPELVKLIPKSENPMVKSEEFEDITICEASDINPQVDFCGIDFDDEEESIVLNFWISNNTTSELVYWLMNIKVNGETIGDLEWLGSAKIREHQFYSYEVTMPEAIDYSDITSIEFYLEIDRTENGKNMGTIFDSKAFYIRCNTEEQMFSVDNTED